MRISLSGDALEGFVLEYPPVLAYPQWGAVNETDAAALAIGLDKYGQLDNCAFLKFNETAVRRNFRKKDATFARTHDRNASDIYSLSRRTTQGLSSPRHLTLCYPGDTCASLLILGRRWFLEG